MATVVILMFEIRQLIMNEKRARFAVYDKRDISVVICDTYIFP